ncbi:MAG: hypothetical protein HGA31_04620 [Candidatus Moranbacteria bacterium]|nr:hypothetical protein [Candidatus Moranbacteria bacterium]
MSDKKYVDAETVFGDDHDFLVSTETVKEIVGSADTGDASKKAVIEYLEKLGLFKKQYVGSLGLGLHLGPFMADPGCWPILNDLDNLDNLPFIEAEVRRG